MKGRRVKVLSRIGVIAVCLLLAACNDELYRNLSARDANEIVAVLHRANISASREVDGANFKVSVSRGNFAQAVEVLSRAGLPREQFRSMGEVFTGDSLIVSPFEQKARMVYAVSQELSKTIKAISGVQSARVHVVMPETDLRMATPMRASASVVVMHRPKVDMSELSSKIRLIVANAVPELSERDVSVAFFPAEDEIEDFSQSSSASMRNGSMLTWLLWLLAGGAMIAAVLSLLVRRKPT
jgi:type III secretion protein J